MILKEIREVRDEKILVEMFNNHYINIAEKSLGSAPKSTGYPSNPDHDKFTVQNIIQCYKNLLSVTKIKDNFKNLAPIDFSKPTVEDIIIKHLNNRKATSPYCIPLKVIKCTSNVTDSHVEYSKEPKVA